MIFGLFKKKDAEVKGVMIGEVIHYFPKVKAAVIKIKKNKMQVGDEIRIKGHTTDFSLKVKSMEVDHEPIESAGKGKEVAVKVGKKTRRKDKVYILD